MPNHTTEKAVGIVVGLFVVGFGVFWTVMAFVITADAPFPVVRVIFPLFGLVFIGAGIIALATTAAAGVTVNRVGVIDPNANAPDPAPVRTTAAAKPTTAKKSRSLVHCECGEPRRVGGRFCSRCGTPAEDVRL